MEAILIGIFVLGYIAIAIEHSIHINKAAPALLIGAGTWSVYVLMGGDPHASHHLIEHLGEIAQILFFLLAAMTIVELIDAHNGFSIITKKIKTRDKTKLLWIISLVTFFLSAALDNLATTIVMVSMLRKLLTDRTDRIFYVSMVVIAANAGGAWSPIGDVTTTMLWIGGQVTSTSLISVLLLPSLMCLVVPLVVVSFFVKGDIGEDIGSYEGGGGEHSHIEVSDFERRLVFFAGIAGLIFVPIFKNVTHLPPFMGMTLSLGVLWVITELLHRGKNSEEKDPLSVVGVLTRVDVPSMLFFLGILVAVACLQTVGILKNLAMYLDSTIQNIYIIGVVLGFLSAIVDNVPLVAASMGMYDLVTYPTDHTLWLFIAYCAGTGGSSLIIGSAAGVAAMGMEDINFMWYMKKITWIAVLGYLAGVATYLLQSFLLGTL